MQHVSEWIVPHSMILIQCEIKAAITFRIWRNSLSRRFARFSIRVIAESGLLYTLTSIAAFCMVFPTSFSGYAIASALPRQYEKCRTMRNQVHRSFHPAHFPA